MNAVLQEPRKHRLSRDDYYRMAEVGILAPDARVELINGEIIDMALIGKTHCGVVDYLTMALTEAVRGKAIVRVQGAVTLDNFSEPQPDLAILRSRDDYYCNGETHPVGEDVYLVIEVAVSSLKYDRDTKVPLYAQHRVPAVLLIIPEDNSVFYYSDLHDGTYRQCEKLTDLSAVALGTLADCRVDLSWLTERAG